MSHLQLTCLGDFAVTLAGAPLVAFQTDKVRALLIYLALEAQPQTRHELAQLLWPGYSNASALQSLRQSLHLLRVLLRNEETDPPWLLVTRQTVQFNPVAPLQLDVARFTQLLAQTTTHAHADLSACQSCLMDLRKAVNLYQGDFLAGFTVADSNPFEEWRRIHQEQLHLQLLKALAQLANAAEIAGDTEQALQDAHRQLALEPWLETAHRRVMRILAQRGQRVAAIAQYKRCCQVLAEELGVEPEDETIALYEQIQSGSLDRETRLRREPGALWARTGQGDKLARSEALPLSLSPPFPVSLSPSPAHNLPAVSNPLVGRAQALAEIINHLQAPGVRLLTLVGPGGMGKTRLAVEVGRERLPVLADGVFFVPLAALNTSALLASAIAAAIGLPLPGGDPQTALLQSLRQKQMLLILDNFEHLLVGETTGIDLVVALLQAAPFVQILITSRERLKLRGEQLYAVQALTFSSNATLMEAAASAAVRLFVQSAQRVQVDFQLNAANLAPVLRICRLVQGMPLGLELAAANVGILPLTEIATEIERSAAFLKVDWRDAPERQRSMYAVFAWSWRLLDEQERQVFRRLALFQGGFTRAAAEIVAGATLAALIRLVHKSLLQWNETDAGEGRYLVHELLRQFAAAELAATDEEPLVASRHSEYYLTFLATQQQPILRNAPREAVQAIQQELDNIRQAWRWGAGVLASTLIEQCSLTLREFYWLTGLIDEGIEMFRLAARARQVQRLAQQPLGEAEHQADNDRHADSRLASLLLGMAANLLIPVGRHEEAFELAAEALQLAPPDANPEGAALGYLVQGQALRRQGKSDQAQRLLEQTIQIGQQARRETTNAELMLDIERRAYSWLASIALSNDNYPIARVYTAHQLEISRRLQKSVGESMALTSLVDIDKALGDYTTAQQNAEQALAAARNVGFQWGETVCLEHLAEITWAQGDYSQAQTLHEQVARFYHEMSRPLEEATVSHNLGRLYLRLGDVARARSWIDQAFRLLHALGLPARETFWATLSRAWLGYLTDDFSQALVDAEQGWLMARQIDGGASQAYALVLLGLIRERLQQPAAAATAYQEALTIYLRVGLIHRTVEPRAGLARLALAAGEPANAESEIEKILPILKDYPLAGFDEPFQVYLTCYTVLTACDDARAVSILQIAHEWLAAYAQRILDPMLRCSFLENVVTHRALVEAYTELRASCPFPSTTGRK